ncbi:MAG: DUF424 family protein [Candidatus Micrarchaeota archaeon]|nr:DUF424 family protein [Candidatus Micrarchaeota archaeon]
MHCKRHQQGRHVIYALCDKELIGKVLREGNIVIDLHTHSQFYIGNDEIGPDFESINAVGEQSVQLLINMGLLKRGQEKKVQGVPYAQVYRV